MCFMAFALQAQDSDNLISQNFEIQSEKSKMGLKNKDTGTLEIPMEKCFLYISDHSNALLKVTKEEIEVYTYFLDTLRLVHQPQNKTLLSFAKFHDWRGEDDVWRNIIVLKDSTVDALTGSAPTYYLPRNYLFNAELGLELVGDKIFIQDRKMTGEPGTDPLIDEDPESPNFGEPLIVTDPETGMQSFVYDPPSPAIGNSGIYKSKKKNWFLQPEYFAVTPTFDGYVYETLVDYEWGLQQSQYHSYTYGGELKRTPFNDKELLDDPSLFAYIIPYFKCDSIVSLSKSDLEQLEYRWSVPIHFYSGLKIGVYDWYNRDVVVSPKDLYLPLEFMEYGGWIGVDEELISISTPFLNETYGFEKGVKLSFVTNYASYPSDGFDAFEMKSKIESEEHFFIVPEFKDPKEVDTSLLGDATFNDFMDFSLHCVLENLGNGLILVNHQQGMRVGTVPLIDEDPNSPNFGENLIVTDSVTGMQSFMYDLLVPYADKACVFDLKTHSWIIVPQYYFIEATEENFISHNGVSNRLLTSKQPTI